MSTITNEGELDQAMTDAELTGEERELVVKMLEDSDATAEEAIEAAIAMREAPPAPRDVELEDVSEGEPSNKQLAALEQENRRHVERVHDVMGGFVRGFVPCSECDGLGLEPPGPKPRSHEFFQACGTCNGYGQVLTGSREQQFSAIACPDCGGRGYLEMMVDNTPAVELVKQLRAQRAATPVVEGVAPPPAHTVSAPTAIEYGRPAWMGDPAIGN